MKRHQNRPSRHDQTGISLVIVLVLMIATIFLGASATKIALQGEKASQGDRDRQLAFQAAEAALIDAQRDIDVPPGSTATPRTYAFARNSAEGFPSDSSVDYCNANSTPGTLGLCRYDPNMPVPSWLAVDLEDTSSSALSVPYGQFTDHVFPTPGGALPSKLPRYLIEPLPYNQPGESTSGPPQFIYRITAIGFGKNSNTHVVLQAFYLKEL